MAGENKLEKYLIAQCKSFGVLCRKLQWVGRSGGPDRFLAYEGHIVLLELKNPNKKGSLSELQKYELKHLIENGVIALTADSYEEVDAILERLVS